MPELKPFQAFGVSFLKAVPHAILGDEQGLGKTVQAASILQPGSIVVCPSHLVLNWVSELKLWRPELKVQAFKHGKDRLADDTDVAVVSYSLLPKVKLPAAWTLVCDEAHFCKDRKSQRSQAVAQYAACADRVVLLTGTPLPNRTRELWTLLRLVRATELTYFEFTERYSGGCKRVVKQRATHGPQKGQIVAREIWEDGGATNLGELRKVLARCMLRRVKSEVLTELPPKTHQIIPLDLKSTPAERETLRALIADEELDPTNVPFELQARLRKELGLSKVDSVVEHVTTLLEDDSEKKIILFGWHIEVLDALQAALHEQFGVLRVDGQTPLHVRHERVKQFQSDGGPRIFLGNIQAAGTGLTLTAANTVVFAELDWVPGNLAQATDRAHRIGQRDNVLVQYLVSDDGLEHRLLESQWEKITTIDTVLAQ